MSVEEQQLKTDVLPQRFEDEELRKLLHDPVSRKGLVGAAKALGMNFRTLTGGIGLRQAVPANEGGPGEGNTGRRR